jgi:hypothetical protein
MSTRKDELISLLAAMAADGWDSPHSRGRAAARARGAARELYDLGRSEQEKMAAEARVTRFREVFPDFEAWRQILRDRIELGLADPETVAELRSRTVIHVRNDSADGTILAAAQDAMQFWRSLGYVVAPVPADSHEHSYGTPCAACTPPGGAA